MFVIVQIKWQLQTQSRYKVVVLNKYCPQGDCVPRARHNGVALNVFIIFQMAIADPSPGTTFVILNVFVFNLAAIADLHAMAIPDPPRYTLKYPNCNCRPQSMRNVVVLNVFIVDNWLGNCRPQSRRNVVC